MLLSAVVTKGELVELVDSITPLRIAIDERRGRAVTLGQLRLELVPGRGLRVGGDAHIAWEVAGLAIPITLQAWQVMLLPRVVIRGRSSILVFDPSIEELDLKGVPVFLDEKIAEAIRDAIAQNRKKLAWDFARALSKRIPLSTRIGPAQAFELTVVEGTVEITEDELRLMVRFEACFEPRETARDVPVAAPRESVRAVSPVSESCAKIS